MRCLLVIFVMAISAKAEELRMNQLQVMGTHNSYHLAPKAKIIQLASMFSKKGVRAWSYSHKLLDEQLGVGVRQIELDLYLDPKGGVFAERGHEKLVAMKRPGLKVLHVPKVDFRSNYATFQDALKAVRKWSKKNQNHVPVMILLELKDTKLVPFGPDPVKFDRAKMEGVEEELLEVFQRDELITPDLVRGDSATLRGAILKKGWPLLSEVRGKVMFCLDNGGRHRDSYLKGNPSLEARLLFASVDREHPAAGFMKRNNPMKSFDEIQQLVKEGFIVRTRADEDSVEAYANDLNRMKKALASGAQFVSTDYPEADPKVGEYVVSFPDGVVVRANPVALTMKLTGEIE